MRGRSLMLLVGGCVAGCHWVLPHDPPRSVDAPASSDALAWSDARGDRAARAERGVDGPRLDGPPLDGPRLDGPRLDGPRLDGPPLDGPRLDITQDGPQPGCPCPAGLSCCLELGPCVDTATNPKHCGSCGQPCASGQDCVGGQCVCQKNGSCLGCCAGTTCITAMNVNQCRLNGIPGEPCVSCTAPLCQTPLCLGGKCAAQAKTGPCDDGAWCTVNDTCLNGVCKGTPRNCASFLPAPPVCQQAVCDDNSDQCVYGPSASTAPCDDGLDCTVNDQCAKGVCTGTSTCFGGPCTSSTCTPAGCVSGTVPNGGKCGALGTGHCCDGECCAAYLSCCPGEVPRCASVCKT